MRNLGRRLIAVVGATGLVAALAAGPASASLTTPNDPFFPQQWNLVQVGAPQAWTRSTGRGVIIGIVDTGVDLQQEDLAGKVLASTDCVGSDGSELACTGSGQDDNGHGTHVAGIAAADTNNGKGTAGMAPGAQLVVAKALSAQGTGNFADVDAGIEWVVDHGARVVNLSLGSDLPVLAGLLGGSLTPGVDYAWSHGAIPVIAAGNGDFFGLGSSNYGNVNAVIVGATGPDGQMAPYSSPLGDAQWALVAPGGDGENSQGDPSCEGPAQSSCIISTWWTASNPVNEYAYDQGTSMATPMVSGTLALLLAQGLSPTQAVDALLSSADKSISCGPDCAGRLDAAKAVGTAVPTPSGASSTVADTSSGRGAKRVGPDRPPAVRSTPHPTASRPSTSPPTTSGSRTTLPPPTAPPTVASTPPSTSVTVPAPPARREQLAAVVSTSPAPDSSESSLPYVVGAFAALVIIAVAGAIGYLRRSAGRAQNT